MPLDPGDALHAYRTHDFDFLSTLMALGRQIRIIRVVPHKGNNPTRPSTRVDLFLCGVNEDGIEIDIYVKLTKLRIQYCNQELQVEPTAFLSAQRRLRSLIMDLVPRDVYADLSGRDDPDTRSVKRKSEVSVDVR